MRTTFGCTHRGHDLLILYAAFGHVYSRCRCLPDKTPAAHSSSAAPPNHPVALQDEGGYLLHSKNH
ncbi:MAG TPA: hypothetical protein PLV78_13155 [Deltaproteobacteria bacterium]|nr:hypothetical protein [Deltaproteobacteria bacterium]